jgi:hypothetical protein
MLGCGWQEYNGVRLRRTELVRIDVGQLGTITVPATRQLLLVIVIIRRREPVNEP